MQALHRGERRVGTHHREQRLPDSQRGAVVAGGVKARLEEVPVLVPSFPSETVALIELTRHQQKTQRALFNQAQVLRGQLTPEGDYGRCAGARAVLQGQMARMETEGRVRDTVAKTVGTSGRTLQHAQVLRRQLAHKETDGKLADKIVPIIGIGGRTLLRIEKVFEHARACRAEVGGG
jgi:hypothetical protein